ncbi:MAG: TauD/TfdA family dioxygenase [Betaproteobacteria bacterium]|nr:TauD/TfdA family dioxygenase [Betaproteobacteria bacterium]
MGAILTEPVTGRVAWKGKELAQDDSWLYRLSPRAVGELETAAYAVERRGLPLFRIRREDFPLPGFGEELKKISEELESGRGFVQVKGLPIERYTLQQAKLIYWGIGTHLGEAVSQNARGDLLGDVKDEGLDIRAARVRGYQTRAVSPFHVDETDVVGLLCWRPSKSGGASLIASSTALYNELLRRYPWYVGVLYNRFSYDWRGEQPKGGSPIYRWPVFEYFDGKLSCRYSRRMIEFAQQTTGTMLTGLEREAFDTMDSLIEELKLNISFEPGDMQFLNNYVILHSRTAFEDYPEPDRKRHLLRLWLTVPDGRRFSPETLRERDVRLGVPVAEPAMG